MRVNTRSVDFTRVQLHALPTQCPRTAHALPANTTRRLHAFYARVGAAIPLTGTVYCNFQGQFIYPRVRKKLEFQLALGTSTVALKFCCPGQVLHVVLGFSWQMTFLIACPLGK